MPKERQGSLAGWLFFSKDYASEPVRKETLEGEDVIVFVLLVVYKGGVGVDCCFIMFLSGFNGHICFNLSLKKDPNVSECYSDLLTSFKSL